MRGIIKNKKGMWLAENFLSIVIAILCIGILIFLAVKIGFYFANKNETAKAKSEIQAIIGLMTDDLKDGSRSESEHIFVTSNNWIFLSSEFGSICNGNFCLCMCDVKDCKNLFVCEPTNNFVFIKNFDKPARRIQLSQIPLPVKVRYVNLAVYPVSAEKNIIQISSREIATKEPPIFFIFDSNDNRWKWSDKLDKDLTIWKELINTEGLSEVNKILLELLNTQADNKKTTFFSEKGVKESKGVFVVEASVEEIPESESSTLERLKDSNFLNKLAES